MITPTTIVCFAIYAALLYIAIRLTQIKHILEHKK